MSDIVNQVFSEDGKGMLSFLQILLCSQPFEKLY